MLRNKISHHSNILGKQSPYIVKGKFYSIFFLGYISICHWSNFLFNENLTLPLRQKIAIEKSNNTLHIEKIKVLYMYVVRGPARLSF